MSATTIGDSVLQKSAAVHLLTFLQNGINCTDVIVSPPIPLYCRKDHDTSLFQQINERWFSFTCYYFNQLWQSIKHMDPESYGIKAHHKKQYTMCMLDSTAVSSP